MSARPDSRPIRRLSPETIERIAAGEVVERPASVVKELVENAIDAGATIVTVRLEGGGLDRIEVEDDGVGIPPEELELAVERHATSKLEPEGPIARIGTLGFRGEALAAIASVSRFRLTSRRPDRDAGEGISLVGGAPAGRFAAPRAPGTTAEVVDLFFNTPARRKFLKSAAAEQIEVVRTLERLYAAQPTVTLRVESDGREIATYPATTRLDDAAAHVLGPGLLREGFPVSGTVPGGSVRGVLGRPATASASSAGLLVAVNGRPVVSRAIAQSVRAAFADYLPRSRFPVGVLHLELDHERIDVNVHPTKREIRFARERELLDALRVRVREGLLGAPPVAEIAAERGPIWGHPVRPFEPASARATAAPSLPRGAQSRLDVGAAAPASREQPPSAGRPKLRLLGCVGALYWVAESDDGIALIDQHAASERVLYEAILRDGALARQALVSPVPLRLSGTQRETVRTEAEAVSAAGFDVEPFGPETYLVRSVPSFRGSRARPEALLGLLDELSEGGRTTTIDGLRERRAATIACHAAIRAGDTIEAEELGKVLDALDRLPDARYSCPHGRPIVLLFPRSRLDRWFLRTGA